MIADEIITKAIKQFNGLDKIIKKHRLVPRFETWVSIKGATQYVEIEYTPYADCGVKFYIEGSEECVGMIQHSKNYIQGYLRTSTWVDNVIGCQVLSSMPWEMDMCGSVDDFDKRVGKLIEQRRQGLADEGKFRLFKVELSHGGYDSYDSAVIACVDRAMLEDFCKNKFNRYRWCDDHEIIFEQNFDIHEDQKVDSIVEIGVYTGEMYRDTKAKVICSSYNAG